MSWLKSLLKPFIKTEEAATPAAPNKPVEPAKEAAKPEEKGMMSFFYRKWKDPAFLKQVKILTAYMQQEGVDLKDQAAVKAWLEKNKEAIEAGTFNLAPAEGGKPHTYERTGPEVGRNDPCPCGSGKKHKKCCGLKAA